MNDEQIRGAILRAGVRNLKEFGYANVTEQNILTDYVFSQFFKGMLEDEENDGKGPAFERVRQALIAECSGKA